MKAIHMAAYILLWIGGLNWGLVGLFKYNLVETLFPSTIVQFVYILVGFATIYIVLTHKSDCKECSKK